MQWELAQVMGSDEEGKTIQPTRIDASFRSATEKVSVAGTRPYKTNSSPVYKTSSDTALINGIRDLSLNDKEKKATANVVTRKFSTSRSSRSTVKNLVDIAKSIKSQQVKNIVVVAGAGISTPSGIPDFRTPGTGLYDNLKQYNIPYPEAIFDIDYFHHTPKPFFTLAKELYPSGKYRPNYTHYFVRYLHDQGLLLRMYTQNIDGLERLAGIPAVKLVEAHGTFSTATCTMCDQKHDGEEIKDSIFEDKLPKCKKKGCPGIVKPDIVFFGEDLPKRFYYYLKDMLQTDLVLIMGTSLEVQPFAGIIDSVRWNVPRVLFNMEPVGPFRHNKRAQDVVAQGDLVTTLCKFSKMIEARDNIRDLILKHEGAYTEPDLTVESNVTKSPQKSSSGKEAQRNGVKPVTSPVRRFSSLAARKVVASDSETEPSDSSSTETSDSSDSGRQRIRRSRTATKSYSNVQSRYHRKTNSTTPSKMNSTAAAEKSQSKAFTKSINPQHRITRTGFGTVKSRKVNIVKSKPPVPTKVVTGKEIGATFVNPAMAGNNGPDAGRYKLLNRRHSAELSMIPYRYSGKRHLSSQNNNNSSDTGRQNINIGNEDSSSSDSASTEEE